jgi:hypothetical protein
MSSWKNFLVTAGFAALSASLSISTARADAFTFQDNLNVLPSAGPNTPITPLTLTQADLGLSNFTIGSGAGIAQVAVSGTALSQSEGVVSGNRIDYNAEPVTGGTVAQPNFYTSPYFSTGTGTISLNFSQGQKFLGLLWGSVDQSNEYGGQTAPNAITFLLNGTKVGSVTGDSIYSQTGVNTGGSRTFGGSYYVLINDTSGTFNQVLLSSGVRSFEAASFESSTGNIAVPEPGSLLLLGTGIVLLGLVARRRTNKANA